MLLIFEFMNKNPLKLQTKQNQTTTNEKQSSQLLECFFLLFVVKARNLNETFVILTWKPL